MGAITSLGIGSGIDANSIVSQLVALERKPIDTLKTAATSIQTQISSYGKIQSLVSTLRDSAAALGKPGLWTQSTAASSDSTAVTATASSGATPGDYAVSVSKLASAQMLYSAPISSSSAALGAGTMSIQLVKSYGPPPVPNDDAATLNLSFTSPDTTLDDVRKAINAANAGVSAALVRDASGAARLSLTSKTSGLDNQILVSTTTAGFAGFEYWGDPSGATGMTQAQAAQNAQFTLNGVPLESGSNEITNPVDGLKLTLSKETTTPVKVTVANDEAAQKKAMDDFVGAYNALNSYLADQTKYDATTKKASPLQGDVAIQGLRNRLRSLVQGIGGDSGSYNTLSSVGVQMQKDGSLKVDSTKFNAALKTPEELSKLFTNVDTVTPDNNGFGVKLRVLADQITGTDGVLTTRSGGLQGKLKRNQSDQDRMEERVARVQERLTKQYQALDTKMSGLNALSSYVSQQITTWNKSSG